ncbi:MAG: hypothetical protein AAGA70_16860 [Pseudomonadota bacterium]
MSDAGKSNKPYALIRLLEQENEALRLKSARHEFRQIARELTSAEPFGLAIDLPQQDDPEDLNFPPSADALLPTLPVPAGSIQPEALAPDLPVVAVYDDELSGRQLAAALLGLLKTQYRAPFARLLFLCSSFEAVPFLGRYGYAIDHIGRSDPAEALTRLHRRYGVSQIRSVGTGALIAQINAD